MQIWQEHNDDSPVDHGVQYFQTTPHILSGYLTVCHGKSPFFIGRPSIYINGPFPMAMLNNQRVTGVV
jgi:hypothetical protein